VIVPQNPNNSDLYNYCRSAVLLSARSWQKCSRVVTVWKSV